ncbi:bifunctional folylpolyglutamate synthase/dihydrofolate synthase [Cyanobium sp. ATX 6A2]|uniref:bifunctional folylpolyglutamate synthase/dihydrofolate synthase n=1 Tax=Cyanobium sp. ATX 6A2 TaxID=2823700 RepID=UPI0020CC9352|nr:bifunctional folylpolyglutamate synthase/dihydrofolate synthase [Cyanobium sp. ATX 6A2]MCP9886632.1 bifunctional folylpolyglutamate synthase/dihydrofolate synthase [Cyanobium sp. ATX 6A2]
MSDGPGQGPADPFADLIEPFSRRGVDLGLERLGAALADLGHPERRFAAVQVAGTNGKGSICTLVHQALLAAGIRAGLYTSPHLVSWTERIRLGPEPIATDALRRQLQVAGPAARRHRLTPFELVTAAAFLAFAESRQELVVLEVGLGGRLDATSCHPGREVVGFASIDLDHAEFLGPDVATIAAEKAGVLQPGCVAVSAAQRPQAAAVLHRKATEVGAELRWQPPLDRQRWPLGLPGAVQADNGAVALGMLQALAERGWPISDTAIRRGFAAARWPGRLQPHHWQGIPLLLDGAHNPAAARALRAELDADPARYGLPPGPRRWVLGMLTAKQGPAILEALLGPGDRAWIVPVTGHSSWTLAQLRQVMAAGPQDLLVGQLSEATDPHTAIRRAAGGAGPLIVAGSLYLLGQLLADAGA